MAWDDIGPCILALTPERCMMRHLQQAVGGATRAPVTSVKTIILMPFLRLRGHGAMCFYSASSATSPAAFCHPILLAQAHVLSQP